MIEKLIIDFHLPGEDSRWEIVNDTVMGGESESQFMITKNKTALFEGELSLENYGGFASLRTHPQPYKLEGFEGLLLRIKGDGKSYRLRLKTDDHYDGIAYQARFSTRRGEWITVKLPFNDFVPVFRGRIIHDAPVLEPSIIQRIGFMIADRQTGHFSLEIEWVKAYSEGN